MLRSLGDVHFICIGMESQQQTKTKINLIWFFKVFQRKHDVHMEKGHESGKKLYS